MSRLLDKLKSAQRSRVESARLFEALRKAQAGREAERAATDRALRQSNATQARSQADQMAAAQAREREETEREAARLATERAQIDTQAAHAQRLRADAERTAAE